MTVRDQLMYTTSHEWIRREDEVAVIGITDYAQDALGKLVYVEMPTIGREVSRGDEVVSIESVKVAESVYTPVSGKVKAVNSKLDTNPELINEAPYDTFIYSIKMSDSDELDSYMDAATYRAFMDSEDAKD